MKAAFSVFIIVMFALNLLTENPISVDWIAIAIITLLVLGWPSLMLFYFSVSKGDTVPTIFLLSGSIVAIASLLWFFILHSFVFMLNL